MQRGDKGGKMVKRVQRLVRRCLCKGSGEQVQMVQRLVRRCKGCKKAGGNVQMVHRGEKGMKGGENGAKIVFAPLVSFATMSQLVKRSLPDIFQNDTCLVHKQNPLFIKNEIVRAETVDMTFLAS